MSISEIGLVRLSIESWVIPEQPVPKTDAAFPLHREQSDHVSHLQGISEELGHHFVVSDNAEPALQQQMQDLCALFRDQRMSTSAFSLVIRCSYLDD